MTPQNLSSTAAEKSRLRREYRQRRAALPPEERTRATQALWARFTAWSGFLQAKVVHAPLSLPEEADTAPLFQACWALGKTTLVPRVGPGNSLECLHYLPNHRLIPGPYGIPLPEPAEPADEALLMNAGLVVVPGLAFDRQGGRLGFGQGYYDRFLARLNRLGNPPLLAAAAFQLQLAEPLPQDTWDIPLHALITDGSLYEIGDKSLTSLGEM
ncbi:MAG: 5-formyltetrahydrofolate cyclo-ligase [Deltaproteobacteria bacterium]|nr:5-formyltetrahydrofolate cyclo-ligase [Deltaproteobacteria bacterium]